MINYTYLNYSRGNVIRVIPCNDKFLDGILERIKGIDSPSNSF